ncbi:MAG: succinate--CoA ligase subunit alpha [Candidatus Edwardsbacteria bacterium]
MAILINENTEVIVQGITGANAQTHTKLMLEYGTKIVGGVTPGKGGQKVHDVPVYNTVKECLKDYPQTSVSSVWVPARFAKDAVLEAIEAGLKLVVLITERIPVHDMLKIRDVAKAKGTLVLGGNTPGLISPGKSLVGMLPKIAFQPGRIGTVARSGSITYYIANSLNLAGLGESTSVGIGGDPIIGCNFEDVLKMFEEDPETDAVVLAGEIGGVYEEMAAPFVKEMKKPVVAYIAGLAAPSGKRLGHAGALIEGNMGTAESKIKTLKENEAVISQTLKDIPDLVKQVLKK